MLGHDALIDTLERRIKQYCDVVIKKCEYNFLAYDDNFKHCGDRVFGEFDLLGAHREYILMFEMKGRDCPENYDKVSYQLCKDDECLTRLTGKRIIKFYVYSTFDGYRVERLK